MPQSSGLPQGFPHETSVTWHGIFRRICSCWVRQRTGCNLTDCSMKIIVGGFIFHKPTFHPTIKYNLSCVHVNMAYVGINSCSLHHVSRLPTLELSYQHEGGYLTDPHTVHVAVLTGEGRWYPFSELSTNIAFFTSSFTCCTSSGSKRTLLGNAMAEGQSSVTNTHHSHVVLLREGLVHKH